MRNGMWDIAEVEEISREERDMIEYEEELQRACTHPNGIDPEDGCIHCGFYAK